MMKELSLNVLDLSQNSITAGAKHLTIALNESAQADTLTLSIRDDGCGMSPEFLARVTDPFTTTRTTRRVGMGIPLLKMTAELSGGAFSIESAPGKGTAIRASFGLTNIDRPPLGDMAGTLLALIQGAPELCLRYEHRTDHASFALSTDALKEALGGVPLTEPEVQSWLGAYLREGEAELYTSNE